MAACFPYPTKKSKSKRPQEVNCLIGICKDPEGFNCFITAAIEYKCQK